MDGVRHHMITLVNFQVRENIMRIEMRAKAYLPEVEDSPGAIKGNKSVRN